MTLCFLDARELARMIRTRQVSAREVMAAHLDRIRRFNPALNAIVARLDDDECLALAGEADRRLDRGEPVGPLHGLPFAFKDLEDAIGFPTTRGSPIFANRAATADSAVVRRLRAAGVIPIGKTNVPEFGMGSHTYNPVYGTTRNPYDVTRSAGGSSGGAGAALAAGLVPLADGSDLGGSLRNPASFNNIVALRPSVGGVPAEPGPAGLPDLSVRGPMARSVDDVAFLFEAMSGTPTARQGDAIASRIAWCPDLGGLPLEPAVRAVVDQQRRSFERLGFRVQAACPDLSGADEVFLTIRKRRSWLLYADLLKREGRLMKPEAVWEIEEGGRMTSASLARAIEGQAALVERTGRFFQQYDFLVCAVSQVPPFDAALAWPRVVDGTPMETYIAWMKSCYWITPTECPSLSVPAGFTMDGLPVGIQIVGRRGNDAGVLAIARAFEETTAAGSRRPEL